MKLRVAQIRIVPEKGNMEKNFSMLLRALKTLEKHRPDVVITPECFLDGYVSTEHSVTKQSITMYAIDPRHLTTPRRFQSGQVATRCAWSWAARGKGRRAQG